MTGYEAWGGRRRLWIPPGQRTTTARLDVLRYLASLRDAVNGHGDRLFAADWNFLRAQLRPVLTAIADLTLAPDSILDLGCGDGLVSCFYAALFPKAEVVALDQCATCLTTTRLLGQRLGLHNLRVVQGDATEPMFLRSFDIVAAKSLVLQRLLHTSCGATSEEDPSEMPRFSELLRATRRMLRPDRGVLISTERWDRATDLWTWTSAITRAGFAIDWTASRQIVSWKRWPRVRSFMIVTKASDSPAKVPYLDVLAFLTSTEASESSGPAVFTGYPAEALFRSIHQPQLVFVFEASRAGFSLRRELHHIGSLVVSYDRTNWHERELSFWPRASSDALARQLQEEADNLHGDGWTVLRIVPHAGTTRPAAQDRTP